MVDVANRLQYMDDECECSETLHGFDEENLTLARKSAHEIPKRIDLEKHLHIERVEKAPVRRHLFL